MIKGWCSQVLKGLQVLHKHDIVHGKLTCESIYINSNDGKIKIGDIGIKHIYAQTKYQELGLFSSHCKQYMEEKTTEKFDVYCFGLAVLEMISSENNSSKYLSQLLNKGKKAIILEAILNDALRNFLSSALEEKKEQRSTV